jgi:N-acetylneuraminic acid mutarotase
MAAGAAAAWVGAAVVGAVVVGAGGCPAPAIDGAPPVVEGEGGRWERLTALPTPRQEHAVVAFNGELVVVGGFDDDTTVNAVQGLPVTANAPAWRDLPALPLPLHHPNAATVDTASGPRLVVGGFLVGADFRDDARTLILDDTSGEGSWREASPMPAGEARGAAATCALDGALYVFGGYQNGSRAEASRYLVDDDRWEPLPPLPRRLDHVLCVAHDGALWIVSGRENGLRNHTTALLRFDPTTSTYTTMAPMPTSRAGAAAAVLGEGDDAALYVVGGEGNVDDPTGVYAEVERYVFADDRWEAVADVRTPRHGMGAAAIDGALYVPGGAPVQGFGAVDVVERFVPSP